jgi:hypothetical protein
MCTLLRDHPLMSYRHVRNWPPVWTQARKETNKTLRGEVGILRYVQRPTLNKCYLVIDYYGEYFVGTLIFDDFAFSAQVGELLQKQVGRSIKEIGDIDLSYTL